MNPFQMCGRKIVKTHARKNVRRVVFPGSYTHLRCIISMPSSLRGRWPSKQAKNSSRLSFRAPSTSFSTSCQLKRSNSKNIRMARMANYIEMQLASKKNNMGQTSEGCQSLEFGGWTLFNKVFQPPNMKSTIHVLTKFFRSIAFCCQLGLSSSVLRSKTPGKCELCLELCCCLTNGAFNDFFVFLVYLTLFIWELTPSYSKGKKQKIHWKIFRSFTRDNDKSNISKSSTCFFHRIFTRMFAEITSRNPDLHLLQVRLPRNATLLGFLVQGLPERNGVLLRRRKPLSTPKLRPFDWPSSWSKMMTRAQRLTWFLHFEKS